MNEKLAASIAFVQSSVGDLRALLATLPSPHGPEVLEVRQRVDTCEAYLAYWAEEEPSDAERLAVVSEVLLLTQRVMELRPYAMDSAVTERALPSVEDVNEA
jgi:hypothetical protein